jgi:carboxyl-terminal processing protease
MGRVFHAVGDPYPRITHQVFAYIEGRYVDPERAEPAKIIEGAFKALETSFPPVIIDRDSKTANVNVAGKVKEVDISQATTMLGAAQALNEVLDFVAAELQGSEKKDDVYYTAFNGAVSELDPHSNVINPKQFKDFMIGTQGSFGGIGFVFGLRDGQMSIINPIPNTPADRAGLKAGDRIIFIDGEPTINMPLDTAKWKMRGEPGTKVTLTLERDGWKDPKEFTFTREEIHVESVESYVLPKKDASPPVLYMKVKTFQKATTDEVRSAVGKAERENPDLAGIIMDLRNNPGGLLDQAVKLSDGFMDHGTIVATRGRSPEDSEKVEAQEDEPISGKPLILLINQGSASASEIVSGALRDHRALLIGDRTFGKGSVQKLYPLPDNGALKLTIAQYLTPNDVSIQSIGIQPDIFVYGANVGQKRARVGKPVKHMLEADLKNAFTEWGSTDSKSQPIAEVQYYQASAQQQDPDEEPDAEMMGETPHNNQKSFAELSPEEKVVRLEEDFMISLAQSVIGDVPAEKRIGADREVLKKAAFPAIEKANKKEQEKLAEAMKKVGVDWSEGPVAEKGSLSVSMDGDFSLTAGEVAKVKIAVKNNGKTPAYRIWGRTKSDNPILDGLDFIFGKVMPGEERSWTTEVKTPKSLPSRWDPVTLSLLSGSEEGVGEGLGGVVARGAVPPRYAYSYEFSDTNPEKKFSGNCSIDPGDLIELKMKVFNRGEGASAKTEVNLRAEGENERIYMKAARRTLEDLKPGDSREAPMTFEFKKADDEGKFKVIVSISDTEGGSAINDELVFTVGDKCLKNEDRFPPLMTITTPPPLRTTAKKIKVDLKISDDFAVKELYAYLGEKKIAYKNAGLAKNFDTSLDVKLEEGSNVLVITASDDKNITTTRSFMIYHAKEGGEVAARLKAVNE